MKHFYKIKTNIDSFYVYDDIENNESVFRNLNGGYVPKNLCEIIEDLGLFDKEFFVDIHRKEIYSNLIKDESPYGWLSPYCEWFPCKYTEHELVAEYYFNSDSEEMQRNGWIKVFREFPQKEPKYFAEANSLQLEWLNNHCVKHQ